ncbi:MAG: SH3 domain-containing protein [Clostridia bacterium]|nr:SH3 domain-containing protein [Clostridia bacterium]
MRKFIVSCLFALALVLLPGLSQPAQAAEHPQVGIVRTSSTRLNVRSSPSLSGYIVTGLNKGSYVALVSKSGDWWQVEYSTGRYGWCSAAYIETVSSQTATVSAGGSRLNIRSGPGTSYTVRSQYADGASVTVLSSSGGWAKVLYGGTKIGYVSETYLRYGSVDSSRGAVTLSVPRYSQTDSRWANIRLGSSRYTIGTAGCTTAAMAMVETAVRGYTVTPAMMAKEVSYSSSGNLYWPSAYSAYTSSDYLAVVYRQLQSGKPVMIGGFTPSGAQHWVVIYGFTGGNLKAENFLIRDPGTAARTTLREFQSKFSVFYKIMIRK